MLGTLENRANTYFLNLRFLLIVTVVVGNAIEPLIHQMSSLHTLFLWILTFHMPLFVLVTGYFARSSLRGTAGQKTLLQIGLQYLIFQSIYSVLDVLVFQVDQIHHSFFAPYLLLWFLASHIGWRLLAAAMHKLTPMQQIIISLILGVLVGYLPVEGVWLSISRTFVYLPFFFIGVHFSFEKFQQWFSSPRKWLAGIVSLSIFLVIALWGQGLSEGWLFGSRTFAELGHGEWYAGALRIMVYALQFLSAAAFLGWVPEGASRITDWGRRTLYVFLIHGLIIRFTAAFGLYHQLNGEAAAILLIAAAIGLTIALCQPVIRKVFHPIIEPSIDWFTTLERRAFHRSM